MNRLASPGEKGSSSASHTLDISAQYQAPEPVPFSSFSALKDRIRNHYELASDYYFSLWGEHIHHGYFLEPNDNKETAQHRLIELMLKRADLGDFEGKSVLDVGCGVGGTTRYLAKEIACRVTGITISGRQVEIAWRETAKGNHQQNAGATAALAESEFSRFPHCDSAGAVRFLELDAEIMGDFFSTPPNSASFDAVWIAEVMSHLPNKTLFFENAFKLLGPGGKLIVADWFKAADLTPVLEAQDIEPIEDGMLLPKLLTQLQYVQFAEAAGFKVFAEPLDISDKVSRTWDISWSLIQSPSLWAFAFSQGRDGIAFLQAFRAMKRGYANGTFRYAVMVFLKP
ncbi:MAG: hypothetical protein Q9191_000018 [Dirinaria sp. TL-2023a]